MARVPLRRRNHVVHLGGAQARAVDQRLGLNDALLAVLAVPHRDPPAPTPRLAPAIERLNGRHGRVERRHAALLLKQAVQRQHERVRVDDARGGALEDAGAARDLGVLAAALLLVDPARRHAELVAGQGVQRSRAARSSSVWATIHLPPRLERRGPVVQARVDDLAVARRRLGAHVPVPLQQQGCAVRVRCRQAL
ncbi:hypothetical protein G7054_g15156 [Neopestalotiopsis clavispora]|nr:hypothetical protein G7054_g15156 [Neopestalotiopsis clavispora]